MKPIKCEVHEPCVGGIKVTYHKSIRKALKYCKENGISRRCIYINYDSVLCMTFGNGTIISF